ncbi:uncharacterized protein LOC131842119 [Achroia grisella]|uniref:uncharacterized protein LOC131842119 n=1 Tax=Achroia grisella TaxID=688607 RepID=UPI0027D22F52|nr:uncharacterized protein LOC131842119 [Achroia grisella]
MKVKSIWKEDELTCKPLDTYNEILLFLENPPSWRSLCKELQPHSKKLIKNIELNKQDVVSLDSPHIFCHFDPDTEDVPRHDESILPKTLVCHDMANGYHDDSVTDGTGNHDAYTFYNWAGVDIFCYFSHHLITIPPLGWINVGHQHGVKVIGTIITEWSDGVAFWDKMLASETQYQELASALVAIAKTLKFDGWLLNVENKVTKPAALLEFVRCLHKMLHQELPEPVLIWYDSVTTDGQLIWQNGLNHKNKDFFDACDGLFTNYSWEESDVRSSVVAAGDRVTDLYIGIDVWGRNFYGGGQFNVQQAIEVAYTYGCSLAIFAPAWTYEAMSQDPKDINSVALSDELEVYDQFLLRDRALWGSIWPFLNTRLPCTLPFQTSFCRGQGKKRRLYGEVICPVPWYNLRHMQYQPNSNHGPHGYLLLSSPDDVHTISQKFIVRDATGIIKYQESFLNSRQQLHSFKTSSETNNFDEFIAIEQSYEETVPERFKRDLKHLESDTKAEDNVLEDTARKRDKAVDNLSADLAVRGEIDDNLVSDPVTRIEADNNLISKPMPYTLAYVPDELECLEVCLEDSFIGGSCLKVNPSDKLSPEHRTTRIFHCDFYCQDTLIICVVTKTLIENEDQFLNIKLHAKNSTGEDLKVVLVGRDSPGQSSTSQTTSGICNVYPLNVTSSQFQDLQKYLLLKESGFYISVENSYGWKIRYYEVPAAGMQVTSVNCRTGMSEGGILLGYLGLCHRS